MIIKHIEAEIIQNFKLNIILSVIFLLIKTKLKLKYMTLENDHNTSAETSKSYTPTRKIYAIISIFLVFFIGGILTLVLLRSKNDNKPATIPTTSKALTDHPTNPHPPTIPRDTSVVSPKNPTANSDISNPIPPFSLVNNSDETLEINSSPIGLPSHNKAIYQAPLISNDDKKTIPDKDDPSLIPIPDKNKEKSKTNNIKNNENNTIKDKNNKPLTPIPNKNNDKVKTNDIPDISANSSMNPPKTPLIIVGFY